MAFTLDLTAVKGISESEAAVRLIEDGPNELPQSQPRGVLAIAQDVAGEPMFLMLVSCGVLYLILGDIEEALMLLGFVFVVMGITFHQEHKTERALEALRDLSSPRALVIRDHTQMRIAGREVVRNDILILSEGDRVPADAVLLEGANLAVNESLLTGEPIPVRKKAVGDGVAPTAMGRPGGDDLPFLFSGTLVVSGQGIATTIATGAKTELGKIGKALQELDPEETSLRRQTAGMIRNLAIIGLASCILVVVVYGFTRGNWTNGFLAGLTLAMAMLPEEFPVVLTIFLALGAWRISQRNVLARRIPAVESLGSTTVLCSDKTGTLTLNRMTVAGLSNANEMFFLDDNKKTALPEHFNQLVKFSSLASKRDPFDPMEQAIKAVEGRFLTGKEHYHADWKLEHEYPLSHEMLALSHVWRSPDGAHYEIASKGAPEAILDLCHLEEEEQGRLLKQVVEMADNGLRVLGVASATFDIGELPKSQHDFPFKFIGFLGFSDPIRPTVPGAIKECYEAGIKVVMITGDYPGTAQHVARQIGLKPDNVVITGPELDEMSDAELQERVSGTCIYARVAPEQKLRLVEAYKARGEIVAMTGDGINDAPALKAAHIGIAMGARGTDVAREASSLVLLDDDFTSIVAATRVGRTIYDNIKKAMAYIFAIHVPIAGLSLIPVLLGWDMILLPVHIVFLELLIDPACSVVFEAEAEEPDVMSRPPRHPDAQLFGTSDILLSVLQGVKVLCSALAVFLISRLCFHHDMAEARALTFTTLIVANLCLIITNRSWKRSIIGNLQTPNSAQWWVIGGGLVFLGMILFEPFLRNLFRFNILHASDVIICFIAGIGSIFWFEGIKENLQAIASQSSVSSDDPLVTPASKRIRPTPVRPMIFSGSSDRPGVAEKAFISSK
ncbi:MAG: cation-translocating P-type ATPase [Candidatus Riflebacteria bacterium]|nr:cation-translocating P-type ATPase [Candidatus Riflebacteria bacterium]